MACLTVINVCIVICQVSLQIYMKWRYTQNGHANNISLCHAVITLDNLLRKNIYVIMQALSGLFDYLVLRCKDENVALISFQCFIVNEWKVHVILYIFYSQLWHCSAVNPTTNNGGYSTLPILQLVPQHIFYQVIKCVYWIYYFKENKLLQNFKVCSSSSCAFVHLNSTKKTPSYELI